MSGSSLVPHDPTRSTLAPAEAMPQGAAWGTEPSAPAEALPMWKRYLAAVGRHRWIVALVTLLGLGAGIGLTFVVHPKYEARATIWISESNDPQQHSGPIRAEELLTATAWAQLFRSFAIVDAVVMQQRLFLSIAPSDSAAFSGFGIEEPLLAGRYELRSNGERYTLLTSTGTRVEEGAVGDSVGRKVGFRWAPDAAALGRGRSLKFAVQVPREASIDLLKKIDISLPDHSNFMQVRLIGDQPNRVSETLNDWVHEFVVVAAEQKKRNSTEFAKILEGQLSYAERALRGAEFALQNFRVGTITMPSEGNPVASGLEQTRDPVFNSFFQQKVSFDNVHRDREALEALLQSNGGRPSPDVFYSIPGLMTDPGAEQLKLAVADYFQKQAQLQALRQTYTDEYRGVQELASATAAIKDQRIPQLARALLENLRRRETDLNSRISTASTEMRNIPTRTIEEMRLRREVDVSANLYTTLQSRYEEAKLAQASAVPDVSVLDSAVTPQRPTSNTGPRLVALALVAGLALAIFIAILLDRADPRFRYPTQAVSELGLHIIGAVPSIKRGRGAAVDVEAASQVVEAFRSIRLNIQHAFGGGPVLLTVSSPGVHDGKSLVSSNLALSFAEGGFRTVLVDGDTRRGTQHAMFGVEQRPGLLDYLAGAAGLDDVLRATTHAKLAIIPCGARRHRGPELIASPLMNVLAGDLATRYDVVIVDSPPLSAGIDPYALSAATGNLLLVLRVGETDRKLAQAKLRAFHRLPVGILGAVLNDVRTAEGEYRYYSYDYSYSTTDETVPQLTSQVGDIGRVD